MLFRRPNWLLPLAIGALGAVLATYAVWRPGETVKYQVLPIEPGVLYRSPQLTAEQLASEIRHRGIKTVVNLGSKEAIDEPVCRELGVTYLEVPVGDVWCLCGQKAPGQNEMPEAPYDLTSLWTLIDDPASRPVLIHCQGGVHRTGVVTAMYRIRYQGWQAGDAIAEMDLFDFDSHKAKFDNVTAYLRAYGEAVRQAQAGGQSRRR
jgi:hypothetical protein